MPADGHKELTRARGSSSPPPAIARSTATSAARRAKRAPRRMPTPHSASSRNCLDRTCHMIGGDLMVPVQAPQLLSPPAEPSASMTIIRNAKFRILPPQAASPISTRQTAEVVQNRAVRRASRVRLGLRLGIWPAKAAFRRLVSEVTFWCLIFRRPLFGRGPWYRFAIRFHAPGRRDAPRLNSGDMRRGRLPHPRPRDAPPCAWPMIMLRSTVRCSTGRPSRSETTRPIPRPVLEKTLERTWS
jgi:hypothetical protein